MSNRNSKRLVIDGQVFQTAAWHRGMGKYSLSLLEGLIKNSLSKKYGKIELLLNSNIQAEPGSIETLKEMFGHVDIIDVKLEVPSSGKEIKDIRMNNKQTLLGALGVEPYDFLILSLFIDEACIVFPEDAQNKMLLFYDLIPFLYHERYKNRINFSGYLDHFKTIYEAAQIFTISQTVANDLEVFLGISKDTLVNIDGASIDRSKLTAQKPKIDIPEKFILMPSGDELRKNNLRAVKGFEEFNSSNGNEYKLVLTSRFSEYTIEELNSFSPNLIFTGNIPEEELQWLYLNAELLLFASEYEGLGLPVLEAASVNKKIACSDIPVFKEISANALYFFDHLDTSSIARTIVKALSSTEWTEKNKYYDSILKKYTWSNSADKFLNGIKEPLPADQHTKPRIALLTPHPSGFSAIGKVVAECHHTFNKYFDIDYFYDYGAFHREVRPDYLSHVANTFEATHFNAKLYSEYDAVVYHIGNSDYHLDSIKSALHLPGVVILHDTFLSGAFETLERAGYITKDRLNLEIKLNKLDKKHLGEYLTSIMNNQKAVITHSEYAATAVKNVLESKIPVKKVNLPVATPEKIEDTQSHGLQIGLAGIIADVKGLAIIEQLASSELYRDCVINIFGFNFAKPEVMQQFKKWSHVKIHPNPSDFEFQTKLAKLDVLINYRMEYRGETSLTALEAMRYGVPVVVKGDVGWYSEIPEGTVLKANTVEEAIAKVADAIEDAGLRRRIGTAARLETLKHFSHNDYARSILKRVGDSSITDLNL
jgi:glycosyltransferase involved in cell wall biosynthesis